MTTTIHEYHNYYFINSLLNNFTIPICKSLLATVNKDKIKHFDRTINRFIRLIYELSRNDYSTIIT